MPAEGYVQVRVYTSTAKIPLEGTAIVVLDEDGTLLATRLTNSSGQIKPVAVRVPDLADSQTPGFEGQPFTKVIIRAQHPYYEQIRVDGTQVFAGVTTLQPLEMVPIPLYPDQYGQYEEFDIPSQDL